MPSMRGQQHPFRLRSWNNRNFIKWNISRTWLDSNPRLIDYMPSTLTVDLCECDNFLFIFLFVRVNTRNANHARKIVLISTINALIAGSLGYIITNKDSACSKITNKQLTPTHLSLWVETLYICLGISCYNRVRLTNTIKLGPQRDWLITSRINFIDNLI